MADPDVPKRNGRSLNYAGGEGENLIAFPHIFLPRNQRDEILPKQIVRTNNTYAKIKL